MLRQIFLRSEQAKTLDRLRTSKLVGSAVAIQAAWRAFVGRRAFLRMRAAAVKAQALVRGHLARKLAQHMRQTKAATAIQARWRGLLARRSYTQQRQAALALQSLWRMRVCRQKLQAMRRERAAVVLQSLWRMRGPRSAYLSVIQSHRAATQLQAAWRGFRVRKQYAQTLAMHRAAARIQRAWRSSRRGERLREAFRSAALRVLELSRAALVLQTVWRCKVGPAVFCCVHDVHPMCSLPPKGAYVMTAPSRMPLTPATDSILMHPPCHAHTADVTAGGTEGGWEVTA